MTKQAIQTASAPAAIGPYSQAIKINASGQLLFISGQIPLDPMTSQIVLGDIAAQTHQVMQNLKAILEAAGCSFGDIVRTTIFLKDMDDFGKVNEVYGSYFTKPFPSRATIQVARLPRDVSIEIDAIANVLK